jgi:AraC-like DNA-binding protein/virulence-associated protein VapD
MNVFPGISILNLSQAGFKIPMINEPTQLLMLAGFGTTWLMIFFLLLILVLLNLVLYSRLMFARKLNRYLDREVTSRSHQLYETQSSLALKNEEVKRLSEKLLIQQTQLAMQQQVMKKSIDDLKRLHQSTDLNLQEVLRKNPSAEGLRTTNKSASTTRVPTGSPHVETTPGKPDHEFLEKVKSVISVHIANPDLDHKILCDQLAMSKSVFYARFKNATGLGLQEYIKIERLKNSVTLLSEGTMNIHQIAIEVGFNSQSYYNKCFIRQYGMGPKAYSKAISARSLG